MMKTTKPSSDALDATDDQTKICMTDVWTQMMFSNLKRMAVDESFRRELILFRAPTLAPVDAELGQLH